MFYIDPITQGRIETYCKKLNMVSGGSRCRQNNPFIQLRIVRGCIVSILESGMLMSLFQTGGLRPPKENKIGG